GEDIADRAGIGESFADEAEEGRLMARAAADHQPDLALARPVDGNDSARRARHLAQMRGMSQHHAFKHFLDDVLRIVDELLGAHAVLQSRWAERDGEWDEEQEQRKSLPRFAEKAFAGRPTLPPPLSAACR